MPVKVRKRNGSYRLVEPSGRIARTAKGHAMDGNKHGLDKDKAERQARAINKALADKHPGLMRSGAT